MTRAVLPENYTTGAEVRLEQMRVLEAAVHGCERCALAVGRNCAVPGEGNIDALVMFVGEGPGFEEDRQGRPFVGASGRFLTEMLHRVGIDRKDVYITNASMLPSPGTAQVRPDAKAQRAQPCTVTSNARICSSRTSAPVV